MRHRTMLDRLTRSIARPAIAFEYLVVDGSGRVLQVEHDVIDLPQPTRDLQQARHDLDAFGYCLIEHALSSANLLRLRRRLAERRIAEQQLGITSGDGGEGQRIVDEVGYRCADALTTANDGATLRAWLRSLNGFRFRNRVTDPLVDALVGHVLGERFVLSQMSGCIAPPGRERVGLHTDQWGMPQPLRPGRRFVRAADVTQAAGQAIVEPDPDLGIAPAVVVSTMWMLSHFTAANGGFEVVPGSHLGGEHPPRDDTFACDIVTVEARAGTLLVFDGRLWHGAGACTANEDQVGVLVTFCDPQFLRQDFQTLGIDPALWEGYDYRLRYRLGLVPWCE